MTLVECVKTVKRLQVFWLEVEPEVIRLVAVFVLCWIDTSVIWLNLEQNIARLRIAFFVFFSIRD